MIARPLAVIALALVAVVAGAEESSRYDGALFSFAYPASASVQPGSDPSADVAVTVSAGEIVASVIGGHKHVTEGAVEELATQWHGARIKNRAAWGVKANGGPPRDSVRIGERRWLRWRDRIGSVLGSQEQTMTCGTVAGRLACVVVSAPQQERERADALSAQLLTTLAMKKR
jgi:hypothetical protein